MFLYGTDGFRNIILKSYHQKEKKDNSEFVIDETLIKVGSEYIWLWVAIEPKNREILALSISKERNKFVAERFLLTLVKDYGKRPVSTDGGKMHAQVCNFLKVLRLK